MTAELRDLLSSSQGGGGASGGRLPALCSPSFQQVYLSDDPWATAKRIAMHGLNGNASAVELGPYHGAAILDGQLYMWGDNGYGQLGLGDTETRLRPQLVPLNGTVTAVSVGYRCTGAIVNGTLWTWGENYDGQLGIGTTTWEELTPQRVPLEGPVSSIKMSRHTSAAIVGGTLYMWGFNGEGQLGDGTTTSRSAPGVTPFNGTVLAVALGRDHGAAIVDMTPGACP